VLEQFNLEGNRVLAVITNTPVGAMTFEGHVSGKDRQTIRGTLEYRSTLLPAHLTTTKSTALASKDVFTPMNVEPVQEALNLVKEATLLRDRAQRATDAQEKDQLQKKEAELRASLQAELPRLNRQVVEKYADSPAVFRAVVSLLQTATQSKASPEEVDKWVATAIKAAEPYGKRWQARMMTEVAAALIGQKGYEGQALSYAQQAAKQPSETATTSQQLRVLKLLARAEELAGQKDAAKQTAARIDSLEGLLDQEYLAAGLPFKPESYSGRKSTSDRTVLMELFTGAQCPPCVAADLAFEGLEKTYKPTDLILVQYHLHIPGPDPMTNPATEARWNYYRSAFPNQMRGVPSALFNGKAEGSGGGTRTMAGNKYEQYRRIVDPVIDTSAEVAFKALAVRNGDKINISVEVSKVKEPGPDKKLRLLLTEEQIAYAGSNGIRFHHQVVRAMPGGPDGVAVTEEASKHTATVVLNDLRQELTSYLDKYAAEKRPFPSTKRPLDFKQLRLIAFVQDDKTHEILQSLQIDIGGDRERGVK
jgi:hypothetical protein